MKEKTRRWIRAVLLLIFRLRQRPKPVPQRGETMAKPTALIGPSAASDSSKGAVSDSNKSASALASVTFGQNCCALVPRSQVLSWLRSDCQGSSRMIDAVVLHCTDTRPDQQYTIELLKRDHQRRGFGEWPGYHLYVRRDGTLYYCRPVNLKGCHVKGHNATTIGVCYEGGHSASAGKKYEDNRTAEQMVVLHEVLETLHALYPQARILGHRDYGVPKACPCLDTQREYGYLWC